MEVAQGEGPAFLPAAGVTVVLLLLGYTRGRAGRCGLYGAPLPVQVGVSSGCGCIVSLLVLQEGQFCGSDF